MTPHVRLRTAQITGRQLAAQIPAPAATTVWRRLRGSELETAERGVHGRDRSIEVTEMRKIKIEDVQRGDFIRRKPEAKTTFTAAGYCRYEQRYQLDDWDDISRCIYVKKGTEVFVGFDF